MIKWSNVAKGHAMTDKTRTDDNSDWQPLGTHFLRFYSADVVAFRPHGVVHLEDFLEAMRRIENRPRPEKGFFYISNLTHLTHQSQQVTKEVRNIHADTFRATAVVGASFRQMFQVEVIVRTLRVLRVLPLHLVMRTFDTEEQALAWFDELREKQP